MRGSYETPLQATFRLRDAALIVVIAHQSWYGMANFFETGEIPQIRKVLALLGLYGLKIAFEGL